MQGEEAEHILLLIESRHVDAVAAASGALERFMAPCQGRESDGSDSVILVKILRAAVGGPPAVPAAAAAAVSAAGLVPGGPGADPDESRPAAGAAVSEESEDEEYADADESGGVWDDEGEGDYEEGEEDYEAEEEDGEEAEEEAEEEATVEVEKELGRILAALGCLMVYSAPAVMAAATGFLATLSANPSNRKGIAEGFPLEPLVQLLGKPGPALLWERAAAAVLGLATGGLRDCPFKGKLIEAGVLPPLVWVLEHGSPAARSSATSSLIVLVAHTTGYRRKSLIGPLARLLASPEPLTQEGAVLALRSLANAKGNAAPLLAEEALGPLLDVWERGTMRARVETAEILKTMGAELESRAVMIERGALGPVLRVLEAEPPGARLAAGIILNQMAKQPAGRPKIVEAGGIGPLVRILSGPFAPGSPNRDMASWAANTLSYLVKDSDAIRARVAAEGAVPPLIRMLGNSKLRMTQRSFAVGALRHLSMDAANRRVMVAGGAIQSLVILLRDGCKHAKPAAAGTMFNLALESQYQVRMTENVSWM